MAKPPPAVTTDEGLLLPVKPPSRALLLLLTISTLALAAVGVALLVLLFTHRDWRALFAALVALAVTALIGAATVSLARQDRRGRTGLLLTPEGIRITDREHPVTLPWEGVAAIEMSSPLVEESEEKHSQWLAFRLPAKPEPGFEDELRLLSGSPYPSIDADGLVAGAETAETVCRYYLMRPESRAELTTLAAVERVRDLGGS